MENLQMRGCPCLQIFVHRYDSISIVVSDCDHGFTKIFHLITKKAIIWPWKIVLLCFVVNLCLFYKVLPTDVISNVISFLWNPYPSIVEMIGEKILVVAIYTLPLSSKVHIKENTFCLIGRGVAMTIHRHKFQVLWR